MTWLILEYWPFIEIDKLIIIVFCVGDRHTRKHDRLSSTSLNHVWYWDLSKVLVCQILTPSNISNEEDIQVCLFLPHRIYYPRPNMSLKDPRASMRKSNSPKDRAIKLHYLRCGFDVSQCRAVDPKRWKDGSDENRVTQQDMCRWPIPASPW